MQQPTEDTAASTLWSLFGDVSQKNEDATQAFQRVILTILNVKLPKKHVFPVYDYFHDVHKKTHFICYGEVPKVKKFTFAKVTLSWFTFQQITKLALTKQMKQDIVVAQRVIEAADRLRTHTQYYPPTVA